MITTNVPNNCNNERYSSKKITAKIIVETGPNDAKMAKFEEDINLIDQETKKEGITVAKMAIKKPNTYTSEE